MSTLTFDKLVQAIQQIDQATTLAPIQAAVRNFARPLGYDRFVLFSASAARDEVVERIHWVEGDWFGDGQLVDAQTYVRHCPVTRHLLAAREPFFWSKQVVDGGERYRVVRQPSGPGIHGLQVPVFGPAGLEGAMSLGGVRIDGMPASRLSLTLLANAAFINARRLLEAPVEQGGGPLSERERQVLAWTAAGQRQADIAATLGLSVRTVENHLRAARRRLGVTTTAQAIRIALGSGALD
ncbi:LuxR C-terminal-related transcriptional regulator [Pseudomonas sp. GD03858]|uniref:PA1136 family autoinducer-binding transcriptional regulator n=1 Tax=unclassified Pseudomonas TaxID=196821 RepID=UPI002449B784|nr:MULTISPECIES: PA1136 family autoinducer-binding transcriptional regulator [unclassified Pseudomonas]MDH0646949.1 LuxR C-terminal-related transcriptional regulator [Pseudomonas sp. GD03867]MDH0662708.1 LuxR C-terminal-related transcriptional regulator [Pseudomonas sp. GD03858]